MKHREFIYAGGPVPELNEQARAAFFLRVQEAVLFSLEEQKLLTASQRERAAFLLNEKAERAGLAK